MEELFDRVFHLKENHTDARTEIIAGITTFMTMAYILIVNPSILSATGMDKGGASDNDRPCLCLGDPLHGRLCQLPLCPSSRHGA